MCEFGLEVKVKIIHYVSCRIPSIIPCRIAMFEPGLRGNKRKSSIKFQIE